MKRRTKRILALTLIFLMATVATLTILSEASLKEADETLKRTERLVYEKKEIQKPVEVTVETEPTETETEPLDVYVDFWEIYESLGWVTYDDCVLMAEEMGMDEWSLDIAIGWTVNEGYVWCDTYLAFLCAMCPLYYWSRGEYIPDGLAGWDYSGTYSEGNLLWQAGNASQEELRIVYMSLLYPRYDIYGCDGLSDYGYGCIYESWINGYLIRVWREE